MWCNQNLCLVELVVMVYLGVIATDPKNLENIFKDFKFKNYSMLRANLLPLDSVFRKKAHSTIIGQLTFFFFKFVSHQLLSDWFSDF